MTKKLTTTNKIGTKSFKKEQKNHST